jgi:pimeloyl-ACP methyl ester carboxylesterase
MKIKVSDATPLQLDWLVTKCEGYDHEVTSSEWGMWGWATDWAQGGPLIDRERISVASIDPHWQASMPSTIYQGEQDGPTPLIAAMRCYVASKLGDTIEIPNELTGETA